MGAEKVPIGGLGPQGHSLFFLLHKRKRDLVGLGDAVLWPGGRPVGASERAW